MKKIMVFGVFDQLHPGHRNFLRQAKKLGDFLVVSVARDINVKRIKKQAPQVKEKDRVKEILKLEFVDKVVLGGIKDALSHIKKESPEIIALGYDQKSYILMKELKKIAEVVRLKPYQEKLFKSSKLRK